MTTKEKHGPYAEAFRKGVVALHETIDARQAIFDVIADTAADLSASTGKRIRIEPAASIDTPGGVLVLASEEMWERGRGKGRGELKPPVPLCAFAVSAAGAIAARRFTRFSDLTPAVQPPWPTLIINTADDMRVFLLRVLVDPDVAVAIVQYLDLVAK